RPPPPRVFGHPLRLSAAGCRRNEAPRTARSAHNVPATGLTAQEVRMTKADDYVRGVMSTPVVQVSPDDSVGQALRAMIDHDIGAVVVATDDTAIGVFTERDVTRRVLEDSELLQRRVEDVMSSPVTS